MNSQTKEVSISIWFRTYLRDISLKLYTTYPSSNNENGWEVSKLSHLNVVDTWNGQQGVILWLNSNSCPFSNPFLIDPTTHDFRSNWLKQFPIYLTSYTFIIPFKIRLKHCIVIGSSPLPFCEESIKWNVYGMNWWITESSTSFNLVNMIRIRSLFV